MTEKSTGELTEAEKEMLMDSISDEIGTNDRLYTRIREDVEYIVKLRVQSALDKVEKEFELYLKENRYKISTGDYVMCCNNEHINWHRDNFHTTIQKVRGEVK